MRKVAMQFPQVKQLDIVTHACKHSVQKQVGWQAGDHPGLYSQFQSILLYTIKSYLKNKTNKQMSNNS